MFLAIRASCSPPVLAMRAGTQGSSGRPCPPGVRSGRAFGRATSFVVSFVLALNTVNIVAVTTNTYIPYRCDWISCSSALGLHVCSLCKIGTFLQHGKFLILELGGLAASQTPLRALYERRGNIKHEWRGTSNHTCSDRPLPTCKTSMMVTAISFVVAPTAANFVYWL